MSANIIDVAGDTITYETDAKKVGATNSSPPADRRVLGRFQCTRDQIFEPPVPWDRPPPAPQPAVAPAAGNTGWLYVSRVAAQAQGTSPVGVCHIRGSFPNDLLRDEAELQFKWPDCLPFDSSSRVSVVPSKIIVVVRRANGAQAEVDLLDTHDVDGPQDIVWNGASKIKLRLTEAGAAELDVSSTTAEVWPIRILVTGTVPGQTFRGRVDLRNQQLAKVPQHLRVNGPDPIELLLTASGSSEFGVVSEALHNALEVVHRAAGRDPALRAALQQVAVSMPALEALHHASPERRGEKSVASLVDQFFTRTR